MDLLSKIDLNLIFDFIASPSFQNLQLAAIVYVGLLWLSIIIWVTRDIIHRSESLIFQVFSILINIAFPILGVLIYLIIRPTKTMVEKYYEELENHFITDALKADKAKATPSNKTKKSNKSKK